MNLSFLTMSKIKQIKFELNFYRRLAVHRGTPLIAKILLLFALAYLAMPMDLIPDFIPVIGHLDDVVIIPLIIWFAVKLVPVHLKHELRSDLERAQV